MTAQPVPFTPHRRPETAQDLADRPVLAVTGLAKEARLAAGEGVETIGAGGNPHRLRTLIGQKPGKAYRAVISFGIAGGLGPDLRPGDVVIATEVVAAEKTYAASPILRQRLEEKLAGAGCRVVHAPIAGVDEAVLSVAGKLARRIESGGAAVDMESHVAAAYAAQHGLPFGAVRVVCDPADRALPAFVAHALKPNGNPDIVAVLAALARREVSPGGLMRLARDSNAAFAALGRCRATLGFGLGLGVAGLGFPDLGELLSDVA